MNIIRKKSITNTDIYNLCEKLHLPLTDIYMRDDVAKHAIEDGYFILNLNTSREPGSHWVSYVVDSVTKTVYYFDSYGMVPPNECVTFWSFHRYKIKCNSSHIQDEYSKSCGFFAVFFLLCMYFGTGRSKLDIMKKCINAFIINDYENDKENDKLVKEYLRHFFQGKYHIITY
jgi:hypothetical protein